MSLPRKPCHNCRRRRLRCDRSLPHCHKCTNAGQECLGYQTLLVWTQGPARRGKISGVTHEKINERREKQVEPPSELLSSLGVFTKLDDASVSSTSSPEDSSETVPGLALDSSKQSLQLKHRWLFKEGSQPSMVRHLSDPFFQDLNRNARFYISHFNHHVCKDLVMYDSPNQNPFRDLIPLTTQNAVLLNIIVANSALHMANASQRSFVKSYPLDIETRSVARTPRLLATSTNPSSSWYKDALVAKQRALRLLNSLLNDVDSANVDVALGSVLLLIEFELADFGTKDWRMHIRGARALINSVKETHKFDDSDMSSLRRCLISNCLVYDVLSSTLSNSTTSDFPRCSPDMIRSSLQYAEANNYLSFPAVLLEALLVAAQIYQMLPNQSPENSITNSQKYQMASLLQAGQSFDVQNWASTVQSLSPQCDLDIRVHIASAHKAAVCIYISRIMLLLSPTSSIQDDLEFLVSDIIHHLSFVPSNSELFKATSWPTFVAGAEAKEIEQQRWAMIRLQELWACLPCTMGYVRSAMEILEDIWKKRDAAVCAGTQIVDWIQDLKLSEIDVMIA